MTVLHASQSIPLSSMPTSLMCVIPLQNMYKNVCLLSYMLQKQIKKWNGATYWSMHLDTYYVKCRKCKFLNQQMEERRAKQIRQHINERLTQKDPEQFVQAYLLLQIIGLNQTNEKRSCSIRSCDALPWIMWRHCCQTCWVEVIGAIVLWERNYLSC